jgi:hypothetical protein
MSPRHLDENDGPKSNKLVTGMWVLLNRDVPAAWSTEWKAYPGNCPSYVDPNFHYHAAHKILTPYCGHNHVNPNDSLHLIY